MARRPHSGPEAGEVVGRWRLVAPLGAGGMATVWRADPLTGGSEVALKILHQTRITTEETRRMKREYLTLQRLDHPRIVKVIEAGQHDGFPWLALELVPGTDLAGLIAAWQAAPPPDRFAHTERLVRELCDALAYVHDRGIIHRDLKPGNVLVDEGGHAWLTDFGVVKDVESFHTNLTMAGRLVGTVAFMAPEQITGDPVDSRADLYGLGALLYTLLTGRKPVVADTIAGYLARQLAENPKSPAELDPTVPPRLDRVCMRLLQKEPAQRYATARDVLAALDAEEATAELPIHGQDELLARLGARLADLEVGVGGAVLVHGPDGSGKSRLLHEVSNRAAAAGLSVHPGAPLATAAVILVDDAETVTGAAARELAARAEQAMGEAPALVVFAARLPAAVADLAGTLPLEEIALQPLDREGARALLRDRGASGGLGAALARRLQVELHGLPGPMVHQLEALVEAGWLSRASDGALKAIRPIDQLRTDPLPLPAAERAAAETLAAALAPAPRALLEAAAILNMPASLGVLMGTAGLSDAERPLAELTRAGHLRVRAEGLQELVELAAPRLGQALLAALPAPRSQALHAAAAAALRERYGRGGAAIAELVAHHLEQAGVPTEARPLWVTAAQAALRRGDAAHARALAERALRLESPPLGDAVEEARLARATRSVLGDAHRATGRLKKALAAWSSALSLGGAPEAERARLLVAGALCGVELGDAEAAAADLDAGLGRLPQGDALWVDATHAAAELAFARGDRAAAVSRWHALAAFAAETRNAPAGILADAGLLWVQAPAAHHLAAWSALFDRARKLARSSVILLVGGELGRVALELGDLATVAALADELAELGERLTWPLVGALGGALRAEVLVAAADAPGAVRAAREVFATLTMEEARPGLIAAFAVRSWAAAGDAAEAADWLRAGPLRPTAPHDTEALRQSLLALALGRAHPQAAVAAARLAVSRPLLTVSGGAWVRIDAAAVLARTQNPVEAAAAVAGLADTLRASGQAGLGGRLARLKGG